MPFFKKKPERGWLVISLQPELVRLAHVVPGDGPARILFCEERPGSIDDPRTLEKIAREFRAERYQCTTLLDPAEYQVLLIEAPNVKPEELRAAVRWRIKDMIDYHVDDAVVDVLDIPAEASGQRAHMMYVVAAKNDSIRTVISRFEQARIPLQVIDIPDIAQRNLSARLDGHGKGVVMIAFDQRGGFITITHQDELYLTRRIDVGATALAEPDEARRTQSLERIALEIQRSLDHFDRQFHYVALDRVVIAPGPSAEALMQRMADTIDLPVEVLQLEAIVDSSAVPALGDPGALSRWLMSIGAGLRVEAKGL